MALKFGFFNSVNGDRKYSAEDITKYFTGLLSDGIVPNPSDSFQVIADGSMRLKVRPGKAFVRGYWCENITDIQLIVESANVALPRYDAVVLKMDKTEGVRNFTLFLRKGTPDASPKVPSITSSNDYKELLLGYVWVEAATLSITQANVVDTRSVPGSCGWVTGLVEQLDVSSMFARMQAQFDEWFMQVRNDLTTSTLLREYRDVHTSNTVEQTVFKMNPANIPSFNADLDILDVYVNGLKLAKDVEYTYTADTVTLTKGVDIDQQVELVVFKSVDGYKADSVIKQVEQLQSQVKSISPTKMVVTLTIAGWTQIDGYFYQHVSAPILKTADDVVQVSPAPESMEDYGRVYASEQGVGYLKFKSKVKPAVELKVNLVNLGVIA